jgi:hypothetical protein
VTCILPRIYGGGGPPNAVEGFWVTTEEPLRQRFALPPPREIAGRM